MRRLILSAVLLMPAYAQADIVGSGATSPPAVRAEQPWARATAPRQTVGGAYVTLTSPVDDRLLSVTSPVSSRVEVHSTTMDGGVMRMRPMADGLPLPAGQAVALAPGGLHIMLMDLRQPLVAGQTLRVQMRFQNAPPLDLDIPVAAVGARALGPEAPGARHAH